jgi:hypothetical protein
VAREYQSRGLPLEELIAEGTWASCALAVDTYVWRRGYRRSTYAIWWIRQAIARAIADRGRAIHLSCMSARPLPSGPERWANSPASSAATLSTQAPLSLDQPVGKDGESHRIPMFVSWRSHATVLR